MSSKNYTHRTDGLVNALHTDILARFMSEKELLALTDKYKGAHIRRTQYNTEPSSADIKIAKMYREDKLTVSEIAQKKGLSHARVSGSINRVARQLFLLSK